jgi:hypothetical protein
LTRALLTLTIAALAFWALLAVPARLFLGEAAVVCSAAALAACLLPAALTLGLSWGSRDRAPSLQAAIALGGSGLRLAGTFGLAGLLYAFVPDLHQLQFWAWVAVFYLFTLALEVRLLLAGLAPHRPTAAQQRQAG